MLKNIQTVNDSAVAQSIYPVYTYGMITKIAQWGNSLGIRIPKELIDFFMLTEGSKISIKKVNEGILIIPEKREETLDDLLARVTPENSHPLYFDETEVGREIID